MLQGALCRGAGDLIVERSCRMQESVHEPNAYASAKSNNTPRSVYLPSLAFVDSCRLDARHHLLLGDEMIDPLKQA